MKHRLHRGVFFLALCAPHVAWAQDAAQPVKTPKATIQVDETFQATLFVQDATTDCKVVSIYGGFVTLNSDKDGRTQVSASLKGAANSQMPFYLRVLTDLVRGFSSVQCDGKQLQVDTVVSSVVEAKKWVINSADAISSDTYTWAALSSPSAPLIKLAFGAVKNCEYQPERGTTTETCQPRGGDSPSFDITSQPLRGYVQMEFVNGPKVRAPIKSCEFEAVGVLGTLAIGATSQRLSLIAKEQECAAFLSGDGNVSLKSADAPNVAIEGWLLESDRTPHDQYGPGDAHDSGGNGSSARATRQYQANVSVPSTLASGSREWTLSSNRRAFGTIRLNAVPGPIVQTALGVEYRNPILASAQSGKSENRIAVVNPVYHEKWTNGEGKPRDTHGEVGNVATIKLEPQFAAFANSDEEKDNEPYRVWVVDQRGTSWSKDELTFLGCRNKTDNAASECVLESAEQIRFAVGAPNELPLETTMRLEERRKGRSDSVTLLSFRVQLAASARLESIPLPMANAIRIECVGTNRDDPHREDVDYDVATNGARKAIAFESVSKGDCQAVFDPSAYGSEMRHVLALFGPQVVKVNVTHGSDVESSKLWVVRPRTTSRIESAYSIADKRQRGDIDRTDLLVAGSSMNDTNDVDYLVRISLDPQPNQSVVYRLPMQQPTAATNTLERGEYTFSARLHSRGRFGWRVLPIRTFITAPIAAIGFRFPALSRDLVTSSDPTAVQLVSLRAGILLALEPWNYDRSSNPIPFRPRLVTGIHAVNAAPVAFRPAWVSGVAFTLPIFDATTKSATDVDASAAFLYEVDLQERLPFRDGSRFLVTFGVDVFSLFGSK